jgi:hypothetical protein
VGAAEGGVPWPVNKSREKSGIYADRRRLAPGQGPGFMPRTVPRKAGRPFFDLRGPVQGFIKPDPGAPGLEACRRRHAGGGSGAGPGPRAPGVALSAPSPRSPARWGAGEGWARRHCAVGPCSEDGTEARAPGGGGSAEGRTAWQQQPRAPWSGEAPLPLPTPPIPAPSHSPNPTLKSRVRCFALSSYCAASWPPCTMMSVGIRGSPAGWSRGGGGAR